MTQVLYVEDDEVVRRSTLRWLQTMSIAVSDVATCSEAREMARTQGPFSGLLVDHHLPDGTGLDLIIELRRSHPGVPALLVTGDEERALARDCFVHGVAYLPKPFHPVLLRTFTRDVRMFGREQPDHGDLGAFARAIGATPRETEVLLLAVGHHLTKPEIAERLTMALSTVRTHVARILSKGSVSSLKELRTRFDR